MKKAMLIMNPSAGKEQAQVLAPRAKEELLAVYDEVNVYETEKEGDAAEFAALSCREGYDTVVSLGGDGTVSETVNGLAGQSRRPDFGIIPLGTVNDFARAISIPLDPEEALKAAASPNRRKADIGRIESRYFMNVLAVGAIAEATYNVSIEQKTRLGSLAYFLEGIKALAGKTPFTLSVRHDQGKWEGEAYLMVAALTNSVGGFEALAPDAEVDDGKIHVFIIKDLSLPNILKLVPRLLRGEIKEHEQVEYIRTSAMRVETKEEMAVNIDGDEGIRLPGEVQVLKQHLNLIVPELAED